MKNESITVDPEFKAIIPPLSSDEFSALETAIVTEGCRDSLVIWNGILIDGHNRYEICQRYGIKFKTTEMKFDSRQDALIWIIKNQFGRRNLEKYQRGVLALKLKDFFAQKAKENQVRKPDFVPQISAEQKIETRQEIAKAADLSHDTIAKIETIENSGSDELKQAIKDKKVSINTASAISELPKAEQNEVVAKGEKEILKKAKEIQAEKREKKRTEVVAKLESVEVKEAKALQGVFDVIVIDPPWPMQKIDRDVAPNQTGFDYPVMSIDEIKSVKIPAADNCHMWLWTTHKFLPDALEILKAWDFKYVCTFVWHKNGGFQPFGLPQYNCEFALYARKGSPVFIDTKALNTCFNADRGNHSEKPDEFYDIVRRVTAGRRADMFNRRAIDGFSTWGKEAV